MTRQIAIEKLHELLKTAAEEGIIDEWIVEGPAVIFIHDGKSTFVPALEAAAFLESLFRHRPIHRSKTREVVDR